MKLGVNLNYQLEILLGNTNSLKLPKLIDKITKIINLHMTAFLV